MAAIDKPLQSEGEDEELRLIDMIDLLVDGEEVFFRYVRTVDDLMSADVETMTLDNNVQDALKLLSDRSVRHIPITQDIDSDTGRKRILIGIVSQRDLARVVSPGVGTAAETDDDEKFLSVPLSAIMSRELVVAEPTASIFEAAKMLADNKMDAILVVNGPGKQQELVGILTTTDIIKCFQRMEVLRRGRPERSSEPAGGHRIIDLMGRSKEPTDHLIHSMMGKVSDIMQEKPHTLTKEATLGKAATIMQVNRVRHVPITDGEDRLIGIISDRDVLQFLPNKEKDLQSENLPATDPDEPAPTKFRQTMFDLTSEDPDIVAAQNLAVAIAMTPDPISVNKSDSLLSVAEILLTNGIGCVPVVDGGGRVEAVLTQSDFVAAILALERFLES